VDDGANPPWLYPLLGCGCLVLAGLCLAPPALYLLDRELEDDAPPAPAAPDPPAAPSTPTPSTPTPSTPTPSTPTPSTPTPSTPTPSAPPVPPGIPRQVAATVTAVEGRSDIAAGAPCTATVTRHERPDRTFWCQATVTCAGQALYGHVADTGYFECTLYDRPQRHVVGQDASTSDVDTDAAMRIDTIGGVLEVQDRGPGGTFRVQARVTGVR
jgi:hypothetical protein